VRPRTSPLFHGFTRPDGTTVEAWTTFGDDQVDVNLANPAVLLDLTDVLLGYVAAGASSIRLDAIGFLWKESGTTCLHLPQTHAVIKMWRALLDDLAPAVQLVTETNVPHADNVSYYGSGDDEAHQVYQFALPPLVLHSFVSGSTRELTAWAGGIGPISQSATWFNFLASHDGIGMRATEGLLDDGQRQAMVDRVLAHGGGVSMAAGPDGSQTLYELNLSYLDALCTPSEAADPAVVAAKSLAAHAILLSLLGVPAIYYHSLFGSGPDHAGMDDSGIKRRINREVLDADSLIEQLATDERRHLVFSGLLRMMRVRRGQPALTPYGSQHVEDVDPRVFAVRRGRGTPHELICLGNVTADTVLLDDVRGTDVLSGRSSTPLELGPYGFAWVRPDP
jgi:glycosidase